MLLYMQGRRKNGINGIRVEILPCMYGRKFKMVQGRMRKYEWTCYLAAGLLRKPLNLRAADGICPVLDEVFGDTTSVI